VLRSGDKLVRVISTLPRISVSGPWARAVADRYLQGPPPGAGTGAPPQPLWPGGAPADGQRFTPRGGFPSLYLADNGATALAEVGGILDVPGHGLTATQHIPYTVLSVEGTLADVLDLTSPHVQRALCTTVPELTAPWLLAQHRFLTGRRQSLPPTQLLGAAAFDVGIVTGLLYPSAKFHGARNVVVFTDRLPANVPHALQVFDPSGRLHDELP
jgi:RES domain-containing protein